VLDGMLAISTLPPVTFLTECSKIRLQGRTVVGERHDMVDVKDRPRIDSRRATAENAPELVPRKHTESQFQRNGSIPFGWRLHRWPGPGFDCGGRLVADAPADERSAGVHPSAESLLVGGVRVRGFRRLPLKLGGSMPEPAPDSSEFLEELSIGDLLSIGPVVPEGDANRSEGGGPGAKVGQDYAALAGGGMSVKVATREAAASKLFGDLPKLVNKYFARQCIDASPFESKSRTIHPHVSRRAVELPNQRAALWRVRVERLVSRLLTCAAI